MISLNQDGQNSSTLSLNSQESASSADNIKVVVRVRPVDSRECCRVDDNTITVFTQPADKPFTFDIVAGTTTTQEEMFLQVGKATVDCCLAGYNGTVFAYGQTGSGKTYTMQGPVSNVAELKGHEARGLIPRMLQYLYAVMRQLEEEADDELVFLCRCSYLEIYNESIMDLLSPNSAAGLPLREDIKKGPFVEGLNEEAVSSPSDVFELLQAGAANRHVAATRMNAESSRSHSVFSLVIESKYVENGVTNVRTSRLNLVDLAGSERQRDTATDGIRLKEAGQINKSLSTLGNVIMALVEVATTGQSRHVPYRNSKLTFLLKDSIGGNTRTTIIANVNPSEKCFGETLSTLKFAARAKCIRNRAIVNEDTCGSVEQLQMEIQRLKRRLLEVADESFVPRSLPAQDNDVDFHKLLLKEIEWRKASEARILELENLVKQYDTRSSQHAMRLRLRENKVERLEQIVKGKGSDADREAVATANEAELKILAEQAKRTSVLMRYVAERDQISCRMLAAKMALDKESDSPAAALKAVKYALLGGEKEYDEGKMRWSCVHSSKLDDLEKCVKVEAIRRKCGGASTQLESEVLSLRETNELLRHRVEDLENQKAKRVKQIDHLKKTVQSLNEDSDSKQRLIEVESELNVTKMERDELVKRVNELLTRTDQPVKSRRESMYFRRESDHGVSETPNAAFDRFQVQCAEYETKISDLEKSLEDALDRARALQDEKECADDEVNYLRTKLQTAEEEASEAAASTQLKEKEEELRKVRIQAELVSQQLYEAKMARDRSAKEVEEVTSKLREASERADATRKRLDETLERACAVEDECDNLQQQVTQKTSKVDELTAELQASTAIMQQAKADSNLLREQLSSAQKAAAERETEAIRLQEAVRVLEESVRGWEEKAESSQERCLRLEGEVDAAKAALAKAEAEAEAATTEKDKLLGEMSGAADERSALEAQLKTSMAETERLTGIEHDMAAEREKLEKELQAASAEKGCLEEDMKVLRGDAQRMEAVAEAAKEEVARLEATVKEAIAEKQRLAEEAARALEDKEKLVGEVAAAMEEKERRVEEARLAVEERERLVGEVEAAVEEKERLLGEVEIAVAEKEKVEAAVEEKERLLVEAKSAVEEKERLLGEVETAVAEKERLAGKVEEAMEENTRLAEEMGRATTEKEGLAGQLAAAEAEVQRLAGEVEMAAAEKERLMEELEAALVERRTSVGQNGAVAEEKFKRVENVPVEGDGVDEVMTNQATGGADLDEEKERLMGEVEMAVAEREALKAALEKETGEKEGIKAELQNIRSILANTKTSEEEKLNELRASAARAQSEMTVVQNRLSEVERANAESQQSLSVLRTENAKLVGHQNPKQKIQHHIKIKNENNELRNENASLRAKLLHAQRKLAQLDVSGAMDGSPVTKRRGEQPVLRVRNAKET